MGRRRGAHAPPPAVADWLERELEARGLDAAALYARYVISVLRAHHRDADDAAQAPAAAGAPPAAKEAGGGGGPRKRPRRALDADEIRRAAAVRCLRTASDQSYEIEALVDELCEKLKEVNNGPSEAPAPKLEEPKKNGRKISPKELAEKYYAAFPPLCPESAHLVNFVPKWVPSNVSAQNSPKKSSKRSRHRKQTREKFHSDGNMKPRGQACRQRMSSLSRAAKKESCARNLTKTFETADDFDNWDFFALNSTLLALRPPADDQVVLESHSALDDDVDMYDDLPVDISDLLNDSPNPHVAIMNMANMRDAGRKEFIPFGTNITSSIWSSDCTVGWPDSGKNDDLPGEELSGSLTSIWSKNDDLLDKLTISLMKINHSKESSGFREVTPDDRDVVRSVNATKPVFCHNQSLEKDDLLTSERSHFKPINEKLEGKEYADGSTFPISNSIDKVEYKRSASGYMYIENEGQTKKYSEFKNGGETAQDQSGLVLKFCVLQNDKACQTDEDIVAVESNDDDIVAVKSFDDDIAAVKSYDDDIPAVKSYDKQAKEKDADLEEMIENEECLYQPGRLSEFSWKGEVRMCEECRTEDSWETEWVKRQKTQDFWDDDNLRNIWKGGEACSTCLRIDREPPASLEHNLLREDISQDGEQLLSDLSSLHRTYADEPVVFRGPYDPLPYEDHRKRRHSFLDCAAGPWSFASRLREDCLITMSSLPTLRSVTL